MAETKTVYIVHPMGDLKDLAGQVNIILSQIADRLDSQEGRRGTPSFYASPDLKGNTIQNVGAAVFGGDAISLNTLNAKISSLQPAINTTSVFLSTSVSMPSANVFYDGPSILLAAGTWQLSGQLSCYVVTTYGIFTIVLWDGTTPYGSAQGGSVCSGLISPVEIVLSTPTTLKLSAACNVVNGAIYAQTVQNPHGNTASFITAVRLA